MNTKHQRSSPENTTFSFLSTLITAREEAIKQQLAAYLKNLNHLELRAAHHSFDVPTSLANEIEYTREKIHHLIREIQYREGILPELKALHLDEALEHIHIT